MTTHESNQNVAPAQPSSDVKQPSSETDRPKYWRSLSELHGKKEFDDFLHREFPVAASEFPEGVSRRRWIKLMGASFAMAGVAGCRYPEEKIAPFVIRPEGRIPGEDYFRATNFELAGRAYNLLVRCVDGRPLKVEPNPQHPGGSGTDAFSQASILSLYDPDRSRGDEGFLRYRKGEVGTRRFEVDWDEFDPYGAALVKTAAGNGEGKGFAVLMESTASPSIVRLLGELKKKLPNATFARHDSVFGNAMRTATKKTLGTEAKQTLDLSKAKVVVAIQADILGSDSGFMDNVTSFAKSRDPKGGMSRLYVVEGGFSQTGAAADARLALRPGQMPALISELGRRVAAGTKVDDSGKPFDLIDPSDQLERFLDQVAEDLAEHGEEAVVVVGDHLGAEAISAGIQMNKKLGSLGKLQKFAPATDAAIGDVVSLKELTDQINKGDVSSLLILGGNPVFTAPGDVKFGAALEKVDESIYLSEYDDETGSICKWSIPAAHPLESWGDVVDGKGNYGVCQPQILPLLGGRAVVEVLAVMLDADKKEPSAIVRDTADVIAKKSLNNREWRHLLHEGYDEALTVPSGDLSASGEASESSEKPTAISHDEVDQNDFEVLFMPADGLYDGRFANNGWLQEMPQSLTKICWDNAAIVAPGTAKKLGIHHGLTITLRKDGTKIQLPVYEMPGVAPGVVTVTMGYGRTQVGNVGGNPDKDVPVVGTDVSPLRMGDQTLVAYKVEARPNFDEYEIATTQDHWAIDEGGKQETEDRSYNLIREGTKELYDRLPAFAMGAPREPHVPHVGEHVGGSVEGSMQSPFTEPVSDIEDTPEGQESNLPQWGMSIDLSKCIGCNACVVACQAENNVPIVGREQVLNSREMHWLRIDRYFQGDEDNAMIVQAANGCASTAKRHLANRFVLLQRRCTPKKASMRWPTTVASELVTVPTTVRSKFVASTTSTTTKRSESATASSRSERNDRKSANRKLQALVLNPEVTVRGRGVMEKCTYCIQRVEKAKIKARMDGGRMIVDGDVETACQAACPSKSIVFGNLRDEKSAVSQSRKDKRSYGMLNQLNVKPRTEYLARIRNVPSSLMTARQLADLGEYKIEGVAPAQEPHHGHHDDHGHGHDGESHDDHDDHAEGDHKEDDHAGEAHGKKAEAH